MKLMLGKFYAVITFLEIYKMPEKSAENINGSKRMAAHVHAAAYAFGILGHEFGKLFSARRVFYFPLTTGSAIILKQQIKMAQ